MKTSLLRILVVALITTAFLNHAKADNWFDVNGATAGYGTTAGGSYSWDDPNWATASGGITATGNWVPGSFARLLGTNSYTITVNNSESMAGMVQAPATGTAANNVLTINAAGSGNLSIPLSGVLTGGLDVQGFFCTSLGVLTINAPITGAGGINFGLFSGTGTINLNGTNTYTGGNVLSTSSYLIQFNNSNSFGTGPININGTTFAPLLAQGGAPITLANNWTNLSGGGVNFAASANTPLTCTGSLDLQTFPLNIRNNGNSTSPLTLAGVIQGSGSPLNFSANNSGTIFLTGPNTYTGQTTLGGSGTTGIILNISSLNSVSGGAASSSLGAPTTAALGTIKIGTNALTSTLVYTGPGETTDRVIDLAGTTGGATITNNGTGPLVFTSDFTASGSGAKNLTLTGTNTTDSRINGVIVNSASGATSVIKSGTGTWTLAGANTYTGNTTLNTAGRLNLANASAMGTGTNIIGGNGFFDNTSGSDMTVANALTLSGGSPTYVGSTNNMTFSGPVTLSSANRTITVSAHTLTLNGTIGQDASARNFTKAGAGTLVVAATSTYTGTTPINGGTLTVTGNISSSSSVSINSTGTLNGTGTTPAVTVATNGTIAPGINVGTINTGNQTWNSGGHYAWQINDALGTAGSDPGWDSTAINGTLTIAATSASKFNIDVQSLSGTAPGNAANFDSGSSWTIATTTGGITGFDPTAFNVTTNNLSNSTGGRVFVLSTSQDGNSLLLNLVYPPPAQTATG
ncbi:MAG: beta strand repeat-containing protein, partial [Limisphaerales bacterium]